MRLAFISIPSAEVADGPRDSRRSAASSNASQPAATARSPVPPYRGKWPRVPSWMRRPRWLRIRSSIGLRLGAAGAGARPAVRRLRRRQRGAAGGASSAGEAKQRTLSLARLFAARVDDYVGDMAGALALVGHGVAMDPVERRGQRRVPATDPQPDLPRSVNNVGIWTLDGRNIGALDREQVRSDVNIADRAYFRTRDGHRQAGDRRAADVSRANREPIVHVRATGARRRASAARRRHRIGEAARPRMAARSQGRGAARDRRVDRQRRRHRARAQSRARALDRHERAQRRQREREHLANREGVDETRGADNVERIAGYTQADRVDLARLRRHAGRCGAVGIARELRRDAAYGTLSLLLGAVLAAWLGVRIARPLRSSPTTRCCSPAGTSRTARRWPATTRRASSPHAEPHGADGRGPDAGAARQDGGARGEDAGARAQHRRAVDDHGERARADRLRRCIDERFRFVNEYVRDVFGVAPEKLIGRTLRETCSATRSTRGSKAGCATCSPECHRRSRRASRRTARRPCSSSAAFPTTASGQDVRGAYVVCQDITRRKEAEEALAARERFVRLIADGVPARITYSDTCRARCCSATALRRVLGKRSASAIVGPPRRRRRVAGRVRADPARARSAAIAAKRGASTSSSIAPKATQYYQVDHVPDVDAHGDVHGIVTISQDVTALRQAKQALTASERRMRMIADNLPALIAYLTADERYLFVNARCQQMFGLDARADSSAAGSVDLLTPEAYAQTAPHIDARAARASARASSATLTRNGRRVQRARRAAFPTSTRAATWSASTRSCRTSPTCATRRRRPRRASSGCAASPTTSRR